MSDSPPPPPGDDDDGLAGDPAIRAGELVLGLLAPAEAAAVRIAAMTDLGMADAIVRWEVRLAPLAALAPDIAPPAGLFDRIEASLDREAGGGSGAAAPMPAPSAVWRWRAATAGALALAAALGFVAFLPRATLPVQVAALAPVNGPKPAFLAQVVGETVVVVTGLAPDAVPVNRDLQLWLLPPGAPTPLSLGVLPATGQTVRLPGPQPMGTQLLVSLEPRGGSTTGRPTGPVLYAGSLSPG